MGRFEGQSRAVDFQKNIYVTEGNVRQTGGRKRRRKKIQTCGVCLFLESGKPDTSLTDGWPYRCGVHEAAEIILGIIHIHATFGKQQVDDLNVSEILQRIKVHFKSGPSALGSFAACSFRWVYNSNMHHTCIILMRKYYILIIEKYNIIIYIFIYINTQLLWSYILVAAVNFKILSEIYLRIFERNG